MGHPVGAFSRVGISFAFTKKPRGTFQNAGMLAKLIAQGEEHEIETDQYRADGIRLINCV